MPGDVTLWPTLTGGEVIDLLSRLRGGSDRVRRDELLQRFELAGSRCSACCSGRRWARSVTSSTRRRSAS